jgi:hypothetical protein
MDINSEAVYHGRNQDTGAYKDDRYVRCDRCGFVCHLDRDHKEPEGSKLGWGSIQPSTTLDGAVTAGDTTINVDSTSGFTTPSDTEYIYIYDVSPATGGMNKVSYTGLTSTSFTGCSGATTHADGMVVRGEQVEVGCPQCGTYLYNK